MVGAWALSGRKFADGIMTVVRVQKLSMPGTGGEPADSPFAFREERSCPKNSLPTSSRWRSSEAPASQSRTKGACCRLLADIGYFPVVNGCQSFFRDPSTRVYREGATFRDILALCKFDVELREIMLGALSRSRRRSGRRWPTSSALHMASPRAST